MQCDTSGRLLFHTSPSDLSPHLCQIMYRLLHCGLYKCDYPIPETLSSEDFN